MIHFDFRFHWYCFTQIQNVALDYHFYLFVISETLIFEAGNFRGNFEAFWIIERDSINNIDELFSMS